MIKYKFLFVLILLAWVGYKVLDPKKNIMHVEAVGDGLYMEIYNKFQGGVYGGQIVTYYITDSLNFRKYIGSCDEKENYEFEIRADSLFCRKWSGRNIEKLGMRTIDSSAFSIAELKDENYFD